MTQNDLFRAGHLTRLYYQLDPDGQRPEILDWLQCCKNSGRNDFRPYLAQCLANAAGNEAKRPTPWKPEALKRCLADFLIGRRRTQLDEPDLWAEAMALPFAVSKDTEFVALLALRHSLTREQLRSRCRHWCSKFSSVKLQAFINKYDDVAEAIADGGFEIKYDRRSVSSLNEENAYGVELVDTLSENPRAEASREYVPILERIERKHDDLEAYILLLADEGMDAIEIYDHITSDDPDCLAAWSYHRIDKFLRDARRAERQQQMREAT